MRARSTEPMLSCRSRAGNIKLC